MLNLLLGHTKAEHLPDKTRHRDSIEDLEVLQEHQSVLERGETLSLSLLVLQYCQGCPEQDLLPLAQKQLDDPQVVLEGEASAVEGDEPAGAVLDGVYLVLQQVVVELLEVLLDQTVQHEQVYLDLLQVHQQFTVPQSSEDVVGELEG